MSEPSMIQAGPSFGLARQCSRIKRDGIQCQRPAMKGGTLCSSHGGKRRDLQRKAIVRAEISAWGLNDEHVDPGETLLRLVSQSARRVAFYGELLRQAYEAADQRGEQDPFEMPRGVLSLVGKTYRTTQEGNSVESGEAIRALVLLEGQERKQCADFCEKAIRAGLAERQVRVAEQQGAAIIGAIMVALDRAGIVGPARLEAQNAASDYLLQIGT